MRRRKISPGDAPKKQEPDRAIEKRPPADFEVREGDRLVITYAGAKLQIEPYSTVELDGTTYSRTMEPGDDAAAEWDRVYDFLKAKALARAKDKLRTFAEELAAAKRVAAGRDDER